MSRTITILNNNWKFHSGPIDNGQLPTLDDTLWESVNLPDDFQMRLPWIENGDPGRGYKPMCEGWYRKKLLFNPAWKGKKILIDIESIMLRGKLFCNGEEVGSTSYGYLGFEANISKFFENNKEVTLAIYCTSSKEENSRWYTGCGVRGNIKLIAKSPLSFARHPLFVKSTLEKDNTSNIEITAAVEGLQEDIQFGKIINIDTIKYASKVLPEMDLVAEIFDPNGKLVARKIQPFPRRTRRKSEEVTLGIIPLKNPAIWSCETPNLYTAEVSLYAGELLVDKVSTRFGIRKIEFNKEQGFLLNGKKVFLQGSASHHDFLGPLGANCKRKDFERLFDTLAEFGFNHIRCAHNPNPEIFYDVADEKGFLIVDELYDGWAQEWAGGEKPWMQLWPENLPEWVKRDRNHPSVIAWSLGNEIQMREDRSEFPGNDYCVTGYKVLSTLLKRYDDTRPTTVACFPARAGAINRFDPEFNTHVVPPELAQVGEISSFNYFPEYYNTYREHSPHMIMYQSEAKVKQFSQAYTLMDKEKMVGLAYWGAVSYWGESFGYPYKGWDTSFFDHTLLPRPQANLIKSLFKEEFTLSMGIVDEENCQDSLEDIIESWKSVSSHWNRKENNCYSVLVYTNGAKAELFLNGKSLGVKENNSSFKNVILFNNIPYSKGTLAVVAYNDKGEKLEYAIETAQEAVKLLLVPEKGSWKSDGSDRQFIRIYSVDKDSRKTPSNFTIKGKVLGNGKLLALANGDHTTNRLFHLGETNLINGTALAILESSETKGTVTLEISTPSLPTATISLETK